MNFSNSIQQFERAKSLIPGGVNSPVRAFKSVQANPVFVKSAKGAWLHDIDGNSYIDYVASWGPMILGHAHELIVEAVQKTAVNGTSFGAPTELETEMAALICEMVPSVEMVRMVNSGTEATMSAIRLARGYTGKEVIIKFAGCYHGHGDSFLIKAGSGALTLGLPDSPGVTKSTAKDTLTAEFNDLASVEKLFNDFPGQIAAVIIEPIAGNMGVVVPQEGFLQGLRKLTQQHKALLIFDEVMTGFRVARGGAQALYGVQPDLTTMGKIIGGGLPVGAYGGKKEIMEMLAPNGPVYQAGTLSGNPLAMAAGLTALSILNKTDGIYDRLEAASARLEDGLQQIIRKTGVPAVINRAGSMLTLFFTKEKQVNGFNQAMKCNTGMYAAYFKLALEKGIYLAPSQFEAAFVSAAHTNQDIDETLEAADVAFKSII
ncbi:MAG: glutamate-1-semialdehyde 2,1-aminomutase [Bacteroidales bacterium]|nr:glutamate-1-semialdehyde 2,1-aminomutase [Bacteroidales bacterium]